MKHTFLRMTLLCSGLLTAMTTSATLANDVVLAIDIQNDFCEENALGIKGSLGIPGANKQYIKAVSDFLTKLRDHGIDVVHSQDFHPKDSISFASHPHWEYLKNQPFVEGVTPKGLPQKLWLEHCIQGTDGANFAEGIVAVGDHIIQKGMDKNFDSYSAFKNAGGEDTGLKSLLREKLKAGKLLMFGLATDICVGDGAADALTEKHPIDFILNASRGLDDKVITERLSILQNRAKQENLAFKIHYLENLNDGMTADYVSKLEKEGNLSIQRSTVEAFVKTLKGARTKMHSVQEQSTCRALVPYIPKK